MLDFAIRYIRSDYAIHSITLSFNFPISSSVEAL